MQELADPFQGLVGAFHCLVKCLVVVWAELRPLGALLEFRDSDQGRVKVVRS